jgi:hypothetical protein
MWQLIHHYTALLSLKLFCVWLTSVYHVTCHSYLPILISSSSIWSVVLMTLALAE